MVENMVKLSHLLLTAKESAISFKSNPLWPGTQTNLTFLEWGRGGINARNAFIMCNSAPTERAVQRDRESVIITANKISTLNFCKASTTARNSATKTGMKSGSWSQ